MQFDISNAFQAARRDTPLPDTVDPKQGARDPYPSCSHGIRLDSSASMRVGTSNALKCCPRTRALSTQRASLERGTRADAMSSDASVREPSRPRQA
eukprot:2994153-Prymnesium_polylepis.1